MATDVVIKRLSKVIPGGGPGDGQEFLYGEDELDRLLANEGPETPQLYRYE